MAEAVRESRTQRVHFPPKLVPLMDTSKRYRYYVAYGGRGSAKSWSFARALILQGMNDPLRILCAREIQNTLADSVHQLLCDQIKLMGLEENWVITDKSITNRWSGCAFIFIGLRDQDAHKIKSYEGVDIVWVEEAQTVTKRSWSILIPTIRADDSEIWITFNPDLETDATYQEFVVHPRPDSYVVEMNHRDNPWFTDVLEKERIHDQKTMDKEEYENIWEGKPRSAVRGAIYAKEVTELITQRRFRPVPYDPRLPVHTIWDLGWNDQTSIGFVQVLSSEVRFIDYEEESFLRPDQWAKRLKDKPYNYGEHWLPHDGDYETLAAGGKSLKEQLKPLLKSTPKIIRKPESVEVPIRAGRQMFPRVYMDEEKCARLLECLRRFRRNVPKTTEEPATPMKDEFRHGADMFGYTGMIVDKLDNEFGQKPSVREYTTHDRSVGL